MHSYGIAWDESMARPQSNREVWERMLRNLANCHEQLGEFGKLQAVRAMLKCCDRATSADAAATAMPYAGSNGEADPMSVLADGLGEMQNMSPQQQQQQLMRMLHLLQLQQNAAE